MLSKVFLFCIIFIYIGFLNADFKPIPWISEENVTFLTKWGTKGSQNSEFLLPKSIAINSNDEIYVVDTGNRCIQKFASNGKFIEKYIGKQKSASLKIAKFSTPVGIAIDNVDNIYITDVESEKVSKLNPEFYLIREWDITFSRWRPMGIAIDGYDNLYVSDIRNHSIRKFTIDGDPIANWGNEGIAEGKFKWPQGIAVGKKSRIYIADTFNNRIQRFTTNGSFFCEWGWLGSRKDEFVTPRALTTDSEGRVYVADTGNHRISVFTTDGEYLFSWGRKGNANGEFKYPQGIAIDSTGNIYVVDTDNHRIQKFQGPSSTNIVKKSKKSVLITNLAVADFSSKNVSSSDASIVADFLRTELVNIGNFNVVEKTNMNKLLEEAAFQNTGCTTTECAIQIGKILNVRQIVVGSYSKLGNEYYLTINLVEVESGKILKSLDHKVMSQAEIRDTCKILAYRLIE
ncbi:MAG: hypothetical protein A2474_08745 [Elusimicrobia bacterium RIFOXYC2_FULL_34_12]|nr:MAG: hypothetical protein A2474_08745 [Elusimicrobia bacterium RIFOXYC2_FULL_34_12]